MTRIKESLTLPDPILGEIWRVRAELIKKHGGLDGYSRYIQRLDRARRQRTRRKKAKRASARKVRASR